MRPANSALAMWGALITTAGAFYLAGYATHAESWALLGISAFIGIPGLSAIGLLAWIFCIDPS